MLVTTESTSIVILNNGINCISAAFCRIIFMAILFSICPLTRSEICSPRISAEEKFSSLHCSWHSTWLVINISTKMGLDTSTRLRLSRLIWPILVTKNLVPSGNRVLKESSIMIPQIPIAEELRFAKSISVMANLSEIPIDM